MKKKIIRSGRIIVPKGAIPQSHESDVALILAKSGDDVTFIPVKTTPTPDIFYKGREWEIKSPTGSSSRTIENNVRKAVRQSKNIIIDLSRIKIPEDKCLREIKRQVKLLCGVGKVMVITKKQRILEIY